MYTFETQVQIDGFNPQHVKGLKKKVSFITDAVVSELEEYYRKENDYPFKPTVTQGFKFVATFALVRIPTAEWLKQKIEKDILAYFEGAREIWVECYCLDPDPPHIDFTKVHPRQIEWNKRKREKRKADWDNRHKKRGTK